MNKVPTSEDIDEVNHGPSCESDSYIVAVKLGLSWSPISVKPPLIT